ncbi:MAG: hypothetical protein ABFS45_18145 [Pseudomonadota bacterium]
MDKTAGALLLGLTGALHEELVSTGPLSFSHRTEAGACKDCHSAAGKGFGHWLKAALAPPSTRDSRLCIDCHPMGEAPLYAHSLSPTVLAAATERARSTVLEDAGRRANATLSLLPVAASAGEPLACVRCHREHRGPRKSLTEVSDAQCQVCHVSRFDSLGDGHPRFVNYPFDRRSRIAFDHDSHRGKHYPEEEKTFACAHCHGPDQAGETMLVTGFKTACGECHAGEIQGQSETGSKGIAVLGVPGLDLDFVAERQLAIGEWPEDAEGDIPPLMAVLLNADPAYRDIAPVLQKLDLLDLGSSDDGPPEETVVAAIETLAWSVKELLDQLSRGGQIVFQARLEAALGEPLETTRLASLSGMLPADVAAMACSVWFPHLEEEIPRRRRGEPVSFRLLGVEATLSESATAMSGKDDVGIENPEETDQSEIDLGNGEKPDQSEIDLGDGEETDQSEIDLENGEELELTKETQPEQEGSAAEATVKAGGWYREYFTLFYRPAGHADRFFRQWLESATTGLVDQPSPAIAASMELLSDPKTPGHCTKCHSIDREEGGALMINWYGKHPDTGMRHATRFSHLSHLSLTGDASCLRCHAWRKDRQEDFMAAYDSPNPQVDNSNFRQLDTAICTQCHRANLAGATCLTCHNYHQGKTILDIADSTHRMDSAISVNSD